MSKRTDLTVYPTASPRAAFVVGHGAGAGQKSAWMVRVARGLASRGIHTATFDFPYMTAKRSVPDRAPVLEASWRDAIDVAREQLGPLPIFIGGKSMGGRIASHVAAQKTETLAGVIFFGYPLHPPGNPQKRRDEHLPDIAEPMLFVQGSRDTFGTAEEIRALLPRLKHATLFEVAGGDHSLKASSNAAKQDAVIEGLLDRTVEWIDEHL